MYPFELYKTMHIESNPSLERIFFTEKLAPQIPDHFLYLTYVTYQPNLDLANLRSPSQNNSTDLR